MTKPKYVQLPLPIINSIPMLCSCPNPPLDKELGKFKRYHSFRVGHWNGKQTGKLWYCDNCGRPYFSHTNKQSKFR